MSLTTTRSTRRRSAAIATIASLLFGAAVTLGGASSASANPIENPHVLDQVFPVTIDTAVPGQATARWSAPAVSGDAPDGVTYDLELRDPFQGVDGVVIDTQTGVTDTEFTFAGLDPRTIYTVQVNARATIDGLDYVSFGLPTPFTTVTDDGPPPVAVTPVAPRIVTLNPFFLSVEWDPPTTVDGQPAVISADYDVRLSLADTGVENTSFTSNFPTADFFVLDPGRDYRLDIIANVQLAGIDGIFAVSAEPFFVTTPLEPALEVINDITVTARAFDITVTWEPPTFIGSVGDVSYEYVWEFSGPGLDPETQVIEFDQPRTLTFTGLMPDTTYSLEIAALAFDDVGVEFSIFETDVATTGIQLNGVDTVTATATASSITASWPAATATVDLDSIDYTVRVLNSVGDEVWQRIVTDELTTTFDELDLEPGAEYEVSVTPSAEYEGDTLIAVLSALTTVTVPMPAPVPGTPVDVTATVTPPSTIEIGWAAGDPDTAERYLVDLLDAQGALIETLTVTDATSTTYEAAPGAEFSVAVRAANDSGESDNSAIVGPLFTEPDTIPEAPTADTLTGLPSDLPVSYDPATATLTADVSNLPLRDGDYVFGYAMSTPSALGWSPTGVDGTLVFDASQAGLPPGEHRLVLVDTIDNIVAVGGFVVPTPTPDPGDDTGTDSGPGDGAPGDGVPGDGDNGTENGGETENGSGTENGVGTGTGTGGNAGVDGATGTGTGGATATATGTGTGGATATATGTTPARALATTGAQDVTPVAATAGLLATLGLLLVVAAARTRRPSTGGTVGTPRTR